MYLIAINAHWLVVFSQGCQRPFWTLTIFFFLRILHKFLRSFVDTEVGQMNEPFSHIFGLHIVLVSGKSSQTFLEHVYSERVIASYNNVDPQVVFEVVDEMRVGDVLWDQGIFSVSYIWIFSHHFYSSSTGLIGWLHDPEFVLFSCLPDHFKSLIVGWEDEGAGYKIIGIGMTSPLFIQIFPHVIFPSEIPAARKMIEFLMPVHILQSFQMSSTDIKVNAPIITFLWSLNPVKLQGVNDAFIFWAWNFVEEISLFKTVESIAFEHLLTAAFGVLKKDGSRSIFEDAFHEMYFGSLSIGFFAIEIKTLIERFVIHPYGIHSFFTIGFAKFRFDVHTFTFDQLYLRIYFEDLLLGHYLFFLLNYRWGKGL